LSRVRALTATGDWTFGQGLSNYKTGQAAVAQNIQTRLSSFLGDCFFDQGAGIDWFNLMGSKNQVALNLAINAVILNTANVTGILQVAINVSTARRITIQYRVQTTYSVLSDVFQYDLGGSD